MPFKLYVDSRFRQDTGGANTDSEFSIELPHPLQVKGRAYVDTVLCPNTFWVIRDGENDVIYVLENGSVTRAVVIAPGQYSAMTLKDAVVAALNGAGKSITALYAVEYRTYSNRLAIYLTQAGDTVDFYPASVVAANPAGWFLPGTRDSSAVTGFAWTSVQMATDVVYAVGNNAPNCQPYHQLFLRSSLGNGYDAIGPDGSSDIIRRIVFSVPLNDICVRLGTRQRHRGRQPRD
jgi:hypothetical protein